MKQEHIGLMLNLSPEECEFSTDGLVVLNGKGPLPKKVTAPFTMFICCEGKVIGEGKCESITHSPILPPATRPMEYKFHLIDVNIFPKPNEITAYTRLNCLPPTWCFRRDNWKKTPMDKAPTYWCYTYIH